MMTHPSKRKGNNFERELVNQAIDSGLSAKRAYASNGESLGKHSEVDIIVENKCVQAKRRAALPKCMEVSDYCDAMVWRGDGGDAVVIIGWFEYLDLLKAAKKG